MIELGVSHPPSLRKESKVDKLIRQAKEKKKKDELREQKKFAQKEKKVAAEKLLLLKLRFSILKSTQIRAC